MMLSVRNYAAALAGQLHLDDNSKALFLVPVDREDVFDYEGVDQLAEDVNKHCNARGYKIPQLQDVALAIIDSHKVYAAAGAALEAARS